MVQAILKCSEWEALAICKVRLALSVKRKDTAGAGELLEIDEAAKCLEREDEELLQKDREKLERDETDVTVFVEEWRDKRKSHRAAADAAASAAAGGPKAKKPKQWRGTCLIISTSKI